MQTELLDNLDKKIVKKIFAILQFRILTICMRSASFPIIIVKLIQFPWKMVQIRFAQFSAK